MPRKKRKKSPRKRTYTHEIAQSIVKWKRPSNGVFMVGYARVSMSDQNNQRQVDELIRYGVSPKDIFQDKQSGKTMDRPAWQACFRDLQKHDQLVIYSLDRLGRKLADLIAIEQSLFEKGISLKCIAQPIDTSNAAGRMIFHILGALAQWEREWNWERTMHGLKAARERGKIGGQKEKIEDHRIKDALKATGGSVRAAAKLLKCAPITIIRRQQAGRIAEEAA